MGRVFVTGDTHDYSEYSKIERLCDVAETTKDDVIIICGDHGCAYYGPTRDRLIRKILAALPITFMFVKGNHDQRPSRKLMEKRMIVRPEVEGEFFIDPEFPSLLFAQEYGSYKILGKPAYVIGGAYSVDKFYRLEMQERGFKAWRWFDDEQLSPNEMILCEEDIKSCSDSYEYIFTHTCPLKYEPFDKFLPGINQSLVDKSTEIFLDQIEEAIPYKHWYCGHYHVDRIPNFGNTGVRLMYNDIIELGQTEDI